MPPSRRDQQTQPTLFRGVTKPDAVKWFDEREDLEITNHVMLVGADNRQGPEVRILTESRRDFTIVVRPSVCLSERAQKMRLEPNSLLSLPLNEVAMVLGV